MAWSNPTSRSDGYTIAAAEWNQEVVDNPIALRAGALALTSQAAGDIIYASSATQLGRVTGAAGQVLQSNGTSAPSFVSLFLNQACGRLTLTSGAPVTDTDVTAASTVYYALYGGNQIALYNGAGWQVFSIAELSIAVPATTATVYDVFVDYNSGTPALALEAWTNTTTRATALTTQDGIYVLTGTLGKRYVGTFATGAVSGQTEDSREKRLVWNYYNRVPRPLRRVDTTNSWTYTTATYQQANASTANQIALVVGIAEELVDLSLQAEGANGGTISIRIGIGYDSTTAASAIAHDYINGANVPHQLNCRLVHTPAIGSHYYAWLEHSQASGTTTWYGDTGGIDGVAIQSGLFGVWRG